MKLKQILTLILAVLMIFALFTACGTKEDGKSAPSSNASDNPASSPGGETIDPDDIVEINFWVADFGNDLSEIDLVEDEINKISEREIGVHVSFKTIPVGDYGVQLGLASANNEKIDIIQIKFGGGYTWLNLYSNGTLIDMKPLLEEYGQDIVNLLGEELLNGTTVNGGIYGISTYRQLNSNYYFCYRTDVLEETGTLEMLKSANTWDDFEAVLKKITEGADISAIGGASGDQTTVSSAITFGSTGNIYDSYEWDYLGDTLQIVFTDQNGNISSAFEQEDVVNKYKAAANWYSKGYVYSDSAFTQDSVESLIMQKTLAGYIVQSEFGVEANKAQSCGTDMTCIKFIDGMITTSSVQKMAIGIPVTATEPVAAMKFLNLLYTNAEVMNLFDWGIEGEHYQVTDGVAGYMPGEDISNSGYHMYDFLTGNQFLVLPWEGSIGGASFREDAHADYLAAPKSTYLGLAVDTSDYDTLVAALNQVKREYYYDFSNGLYTDKMYNEFLSKLSAAGVEEYIGLYQAAANEFLA